MAETSRKQADIDSRASRISRAIVAVMTALGALGFVALLYFPLLHMK